MNTSSLKTSTILSLTVAAAVASCQLDPWETGSGPKRLDAGPPPDAFVPPDVQPDACVAATEICDGIDNDCDDEVDEDFDLTSDVSNCGVCGEVCEFTNALAECVNSSCELADCLPGYHDVDNDPNNGCELQCTVTNDGTEVCDGIDNDCDTEVDEDFDLQTDPNNCGSCANVCVFLNGNGACVGGSCTLGSCRGGFVDLDNSVSNGCECQMGISEDPSTQAVCVQGQAGCAANEVCADPDRDGQSHCVPVPLDLCDGRDNDCDGVVDEDATALLSNTDCYTFASGCSETTPGSGNYNCNGPCSTGTLSCVNGQLMCNNQNGPTVESCNDIDDDCNGTVDDNWDKENDPSHCGSCGFECGPLLPNAVPGCQNGGCYIIACLPGFWDLDPNVPGCEYECSLTAGGVERCGDGLDNDCNGQTDEGFDLANDPNNCGACGHSCDVNKPRGTLVSQTGPVCDAGTCQFECLPDNWDINGDLSQGESGDGCEYFCQISSGGTEICDGQDNDCDNQIDEGFNLQTDDQNCGQCGTVCASIAPNNSTATGCASGRCQFVCDAGFVDLNLDLQLSGSDGCECAVSAETCGDNIDNDCNGVVDDASALGCTTFYKDVDQDTYGVTADSTCLCEADTDRRYTATQGGDCVDNNQSINPLATEICDGQDNDCDGNVDNATVGQATPLLSRSCYTGPAGTNGVGICHGGTQTCDAVNGIWPALCTGEQTPEAEICDTLDNNCDGNNNENFDFQNDPNNCGDCGTVCSIPNAVSTCSGGGCVVESCIPPYYNYDGDNSDCEYYCVLQGAPVCGSTDDADCNGEPDNTQYALDTNPFNCGSCGYVCAANAPFGMEVDDSAGTGCSSGSCDYRCASGFVDLDGGVPGCECVITNNGLEVCDNEDNNCDGNTDEGIDKQSDPNNCGACDFRCGDLGDAAALAAAHVTFTGCVSGTCTFACVSGYHDLDNDRNSGRPFGTQPGQSDGCEYHCDPASPGADVCDGEDNDCDGFTDRDSGGAVLTQVCYDGPSATQNVGECTDGVQTCTGGSFGTCVGQILPSPAPVCGSADDNDCDGQADQDQYFLDTDPLNCGSCSYSCYANAPANMIPDPANPCTSGTCNYVCLSGFRDLANGQTDGCEYECPVSPPTVDGVERCNGLDDDCDGVADEEPDLSNNKPTEAELCSYPRVGTTACDGVSVVCGNGPGGSYPLGWYCQWSDTRIQFDPNRPNVVLAEESLCDNFDNDCDGLTDEIFTFKGDACDDGQVGICQGTGNLVCNGDATGLECNITSPGSSPTAESCNDLDDDCDGLVDENASSPGSDPSYVVDAMDPVTVGGATVWVYRYEASRPDADDTTSGTASHRACSNPGALPWANVSYQEAADACAAAGYRLCTQTEWQGACEGGDGFSYEYPYLWQSAYSDYEALVCNGNDYDYDCTTALDEDDALPTGQVYTDCNTGPSDCVSVDGLFDMSGNLMEWTSTTASAGVYHVRGGSFLTHEWGLTCQASFITLPETFRYDDLGFRCCSDTAP